MRDIKSVLDYDRNIFMHENFAQCKNIFFDSVNWSWLWYIDAHASCKSGDRVAGKKIDGDRMWWWATTTLTIITTTSTASDNEKHHMIILLHVVISCMTYKIRAVEYICNAYINLSVSPEL